MEIKLFGKMIWGSEQPIKRGHPTPAKPKLQWRQEEKVARAERQKDSQQRWLLIASCSARIRNLHS
jgi:hypothetical protein